MSELQQEKHPFVEFVKNNQKVLTYTLTAVIVIVLAYFGYTELYQNPREAKAADVMFTAEKYFGLDSSNYVLNGDGIYEYIDNDATYVGYKIFAVKIVFLSSKQCVVPKCKELRAIALQV